MTHVDMSIEPTSDQLDAIDLLAGPRTFTIDTVTRNQGDQPVNIKLREFPRVWRPGKSMRRVLVAAWGPDVTAYIGRRITLYCDPNVTFGKDRVGGTRISHMSHLKGGKQLSIPLLVTRGKSAMYRVDPLVEDAATLAADTIAACTDPAVLRGMWQQHTDPHMRALIEARVDTLKGMQP